MEGCSLAERIREQGPLPSREAARLTARLARALYYAHSQAVLHRDMKPANVIVPPAGAPVLTGFGLGSENASRVSVLRQVVIARSRQVTHGAAASDDDSIQP